MTSRVGKVRLRLRVPAELAASADELRVMVERDVVTRVLEQLECLLHDRFGASALIRIRTLSLSWRFDTAELVSTDLCVTLARDLADEIIAQVERLPSREQVRPTGDTLAIFVDTEHADAVYLADVVDDRADHWFHAERTGTAPVWSAVLARGPAAVKRVVEWLVRMERIVEVLVAAPPSVQVDVVEIVPDCRPIVELARARAAAARGDITVPGHPAPEERTVEAPPQAYAPMVPPATKVIESTATANTPAIVVPPVETPAAEESAPAVIDRIEEVPTVVEASAPVLDTDVAGLFFLVGRVLEIDLGERLWAAGIPEAPVLVAIGDAVLERVGDPCARWFAGRFDDAASFPALEAWAVTEVNETVQHALGRRLVAFGVRRSPVELDRDLETIARGVTCAVTDPLARRLVIRSVAALATIVCARLGVPTSLDVLRSLCARPGRIVRLRDELRVVMPHTVVDLDVRRAGLDHDPGHVPWLGGAVHFEFAGGEVL